MKSSRVTESIKAVEQFAEKKGEVKKEDESQQSLRKDTIKNSYCLNLKEVELKPCRSTQSPIILIEPQDYYIKVLSHADSLSLPQSPHSEQPPHHASKTLKDTQDLNNKSFLSRRHHDKTYEPKLSKRNPLQQAIQQPKHDRAIPEASKQIEQRIVRPILKQSSAQRPEQQPSYSSQPSQHSSSSSYSIPSRNKSFKTTTKAAKGRRASEAKDKRRRRLPVQMLLAYKNEVLKSFLKDVPFVRKKLRAKPSKGPPLSLEQEWKKEYEVHKTLIRTIQTDINLKRKLMEQICQFGQYKQKKFNLRFGITLEQKQITLRSSSSSSSSSNSSGQSKRGFYCKKKPKRQKNASGDQSEDNSDEERVNARHLCQIFQKRTLQLKEVVTQSFPTLREMSRYCNSRRSQQSQASQDQQFSRNGTKKPSTMSQLLRYQSKYQVLANETNSIKFQQTSQVEPQIRHYPQQESHQQLKLTDSLGSNSQEKINDKSQASNNLGRAFSADQSKMDPSSQFIKSKQIKLRTQSNAVSLTITPQINHLQQAQIAQKVKETMRKQIKQQIKQEKREKISIQRRIISESILFRVLRDTQTPCNHAYLPQMHYNPFIPQQVLTERQLFKLQRKFIHQSLESSDDDYYKEYKNFKKFRRMRKNKRPRVIKYEQSEESNSDDAYEKEDAENKFIKRKIRYLRNPYSFTGCKRQHRSLQQDDRIKKAVVMKPKDKKTEKTNHNNQSSE